MALERPLHRCVRLRRRIKRRQEGPEVAFRQGDGLVRLHDRLCARQGILENELGTLTRAWPAGWSSRARTWVSQQMFRRESFSVVDMVKLYEGQSDVCDICQYASAMP